MALAGLSGCDGVPVLGGADAASDLGVSMDLGPDAAPLDVAADRPIVCTTGELRCDNFCVRAATDNANCGACGNVCAPGLVCAMGACAVSCGALLATCGGLGDAGDDAGGARYCADLATDRTNCGVCGTACPAGNVCVDRSCQVSCVASQTLCADGCHDLQSDRAHCGACGNTCASGRACVMGSCAVSCVATQTVCDETCRDLQSDVANCGLCGNACPAGQVCSMGTCSTSCAAGLTNCAGACVTIATDLAHCGGCGGACARPANAIAACVAGLCEAACVAGFDDCDGMASTGCETALRATDVNNCGGCNVRCSFANAAATCAMGVCAMGTCAIGFSDCDLNPANGCEVNLGNDREHCGACTGATATCPSGQVCSMGACEASCGAGLTLCAGVCTNTTFDPANCNACGTVCSTTAANTFGACVAGACSAGCLPGFDNCDRMAANGCETAVRASDVNNCGGCGVTCSFLNAAATCAMGVCVRGTCAAGFDDCNMSPLDGCESNLTSDTSCGTCGTVCLAGRTCSSGVCRFVGCGDGLATAGESCDDGNRTAGDGCSALCQVEADRACSGSPSVCVALELLCTDTIDNDGDGQTDATDSDCRIPSYFPACPAGQSRWIVESTGAPISIPDATPAGISSTITLPPGLGTIRRVAVVFDITHPWDSDLDISLTPPGAGVALNLSSDNGEEGDNYTRTVLDSTCASTIVGGVDLAPFSGCFSPESTLETLNGTPASGAWRLGVVDDSGDDVGTFRGWALVLCTTTP